MWLLNEFWARANSRRTVKSSKIDTITAAGVDGLCIGGGIAGFEAIVGGVESLYVRFSFSFGGRGVQYG